MAIILNIETSTNVCAVALAKDGSILSSRESNADKSHARLLAPFIKEIFDEQPMAANNLEAVAVSEGPGSYTGLRIGVSTAKGIAYGRSIPLLAISTLQAMARKAAGDTAHKQGIYIPMIDARRKEVYTALLDVKNEFLEKTTSLILQEDTFNDREAENLFIFGDGADKAREILKDQRITYLTVSAGAENMAPIAEQHFNSNKTVDVAYFEPFYLKDFIPTIPKKNVFNH